MSSTPDAAQPELLLAEIKFITDDSPTPRRYRYAPPKDRDPPAVGGKYEKVLIAAFDVVHVEQ